MWNRNYVVIKYVDMAEITWISNEYQLGDFGMDGMYLAIVV